MVVGGTNRAFVSGDLQGDFDNPPWDIRDGPFINKADEGDTLTGASNKYPYNWKNRQGFTNIVASMFTPNRMVASAVTFGSLPIGVWAERPWQTLLFHPDLIGTGQHPGSANLAGDNTPMPGAPADHLLLDLFQMPVVEPYPISEPLSTAGRINLNYQLAPFSYIKRGTGISAILKSERLAIIHDVRASSYKSYPTGPGDIRFPVDADATMEGFDARFASHDIFRSASEVCTLPMVPLTSPATAYAVMKSGTYWDTRRLTGDNTKERIYATVYPRVTTKSNTFTVHYRVQTLKKAAGTDASQWVENRDQVTSEYRGSQTIERYVDTNDSTLPDFAANPTYSLDSYPDPTFSKMLNAYQFRIISSKKFAP